MSIWTHVVGAIRFDGLYGMSSFPDCGNTCEYEDDQSKWEKCDVPCGSEGSLKIAYWVSDKESELARWTVTVFGDLRDYDDENEIIEYFEKITRDRLVRQACFSFYVEFHSPRIFNFDRDLQKFIEYRR